MALSKKQHDFIIRIVQACDKMGVSLDLTATNITKLHDRQQAHRLVSRALMGVAYDSPGNDCRTEDVKDAFEALAELERLGGKQYPDKFGRW